jgi:uncharacterized protein HemX
MNERPTIHETATGYHNGKNRAKQDLDDTLSQIRDAQIATGEVVTVAAAKSTGSQISEKTRLGITIGGACLIVAVIFGLGQFWGGLQSERAYEKETLARHETDIRELRQTFGEMQGTLRDIQNSQNNSKDAMNTAVRNTTFLIDKMGSIQVALAERGITVKGD